MVDIKERNNNRIVCHSPMMIEQKIQLNKTKTKCLDLKSRSIQQKVRRKREENKTDQSR
jgi:hypothetical protein